MRHSWVVQHEWMFSAYNDNGDDVTDGGTEHVMLPVTTMHHAMLQHAQTIGQQLPLLYL